jgi:hypothetical protein
MRTSTRADILHSPHVNSREPYVIASLESGDVFEYAADAKSLSEELLFLADKIYPYDEYCYTKGNKYPQPDVMTRVFFHMHRSRKMSDELFKE